MSTPNSFDIGTYFSTAYIGNRLDDLIKTLEERSPEQLEYNQQCRDYAGLIESMIDKSSVESILSKASYLKKSLTSGPSAKKVLEVARGRSDFSPTAIFLFIYVGDVELAIAPAQIISLRDVYISRALSDGDVNSALDLCKEHLTLMGRIAEALNEKIGEHCAATGSKEISSEESFEESLRMSIGGSREIEITHPIQVPPVIDMLGMTLSSCCDARSKIKRLSAKSVHEIGVEDVIGDSTSSLAIKMLELLAS